MSPTSDAPNPTIDLLTRHRSIRRYADAPVPDADIETAVRAGQGASTSSAVQSTSVIRVTDADERAQLAELTGGQAMVAACGAFFVVCGDTRRHRLVVQRAGSQYDAQLEAFLIAAIDTALFSQNMVIAFESMGYGVCYIGGLRSNLPGVDALLEIPEGVYPFFGLCVGVPDESPDARPRLPVEAVLHTGRYKDDAQLLGLIDRYDETYRAYMRARGASDRAIELGWSGRMAEKFATPRRPEVGDYFRSKGASTA